MTRELHFYDHTPSRRRALRLFGLGLLGVAATGSVGGVYVNEEMGAAPTGERLRRIEASPNWHNGAFRNLVEVPDFTGKRRSSWRAMYEFLTDRTVGIEPTSRVPSLKTALSDVRSGELVWLGHSGFFLHEAGLRILIDPALGAASPVPFAFKPFRGADVYQPDDIPKIDLLLITHDHYDHLDYATIRAIANRVERVVCPLGVGAHFDYWGWPPEKIIELDWFESTRVEGSQESAQRGANGVLVTAVPSQHFSGRTLKRNTTLWAGFILEFAGKTLYLSGDGGYGPHFATIARRYPKINLAILEDGQYNTDWSTIHLMPDDWRKALQDLSPKRVMPCHNAKYALSRHVWTEPLEMAFESARALQVALALPKIGEAFDWASGVNMAVDSTARWWPNQP